MKHLEILTQEQVGPKVQEIFQGLKKKIGNSQCVQAVCKFTCGI